ncbi:2631_t:CDS:2, partial [Entrophospora sp. SA101]
DEYLNIENNIVAGELVTEDEYIIALIQPTEIDDNFDVCEDELKCIRTLEKNYQVVRLIVQRNNL